MTLQASLDRAEVLKQEGNHLFASGKMEEAMVSDFGRSVGFVAFLEWRALLVCGAHGRSESEAKAW